jgi:hypothetical protein
VQIRRISFPYGTAAITVYPLTTTLSNVTSTTVTGLTSGASYNINMKSFGFYGYSKVSLLTSSTTSSQSIVDASGSPSAFAAISTLSPTPYSNPTSTYGVYTLISGRGLSGTSSMFTDISSNFTVQFWWRSTTDTFAGNIAQTLFLRGTTVVNSYYMHGFVKRMGRNINGSALEFGGTILANTWYHISIVSSANNWSFYLNGSTSYLDTRTANTSHLNQPMYFASNSTSTTTIYLAELRVWNKALTTTDISNNYNIEISSPTANLVGLYRFTNGAMLSNSA